MVRIRLKRTGAKHKPTYRIMVADSRAANNGRFIENIGHFNPRTDPETVVIKAESAIHWLERGAQPSDAVARLLRQEGILDADGAIVAPAEAAPETEEAETAEAAAE